MRKPREFLTGLIESGRKKIQEAKGPRGYFEPDEKRKEREMAERRQDFKLWFLDAIKSLGGNFDGDDESLIFGEIFKAEPEKINELAKKIGNDKLFHGYAKGMPGEFPLRPEHNFKEILEFLHRNREAVEDRVGWVSYTS